MNTNNVGGIVSKTLANALGKIASMGGNVTKIDTSEEI